MNNAVPRTCPWCLERLARPDRRAAACPHCGRPLQEAEGQAVRPIDVHYERAAARLESNGRKMLVYGLPVAVALLIAGQFLHLLLPLVLVGHMVAARLVLVQEPRRLMGSGRRFFTRWIARLGFLSAGSLGYVALGVVPVVGPVSGAATYLGLTALLHRYTAWSLRREKERRPLAFWEKLLLAVLAGGVILMVAALVVLVAAVGWVASKVLAW